MSLISPGHDSDQGNSLVTVVRRSYLVAKGRDSLELGTINGGTVKMTAANIVETMRDLGMDPGDVIENWDLYRQMAEQFNTWAELQDHIGYLRNRGA